MRRFLESQGDLALGMIAGAIVAGPVLGVWPLIGVLGACATSIYIAKLFQRR